MNESFTKTMKLESIKQQIDRADYRIDPDLVAAALLSRVCEPRTILALPPLSPPSARSLGRLVGSRAI